MDKLKELMELCKCGLFIMINEHKNYYQSAKEALKEEKENDKCCNFTNDEMLKMIELDNIIDIQAYPDTPIGSYKILHYDIDIAIEKMINIIKSHRGQDG